MKTIPHAAALLKLAAVLPLLLPASIFADGSATRPATPPGIEVRVASMNVDYVQLRSPPAAHSSGIFADNTDDDSRSDQQYVIVRLQLSNTGARDVIYHTFSGTDRDFAATAFLHGEDSHNYGIVRFEDVQPVGSVRSVTIHARQSIKDVLVFEKPPAGSGPLHLMIPAENVGGAGLVEVVLAKS